MDAFLDGFEGSFRNLHWNKLCHALHVHTCFSVVKPVSRSQVSQKRNYFSSALTFLLVFILSDFVF